MKTRFGLMPDGTTVEQYTLVSGELECDVITYGGALRSLRLPDCRGNQTDILLGFDCLEDYRSQNKYIGAIVGRYANRISGSSFDLNGTRYPLATNDGPNHIHGGVVGFDKQVWTAETVGEDFLTLSLESPDGQEGYPGNLSVQVTYRLENNGITMNYRAKCDKDTLCNLTNHAYFNLSGHASGLVLGHKIRIFADSYTPTDGKSIPTGEIAAVYGTPMDLREAVCIGMRVDEAVPQLVSANGYDHNWIVNGTPGQLRPTAWVYSPDTGIAMEVLSTQPGVQFYTGNYLHGCPPGKGGAVYGNRCGFCLETQHFPDSPHQPDFPGTILKAGDEYRQTTVYRFTVG